MPKIGPNVLPPALTPCGQSPWIDVDALCAQGPQVHAQATPPRVAAKGFAAALPRARARPHPLRTPTVVVRPVIHVHNRLNMPSCAATKPRPKAAPKPSYPPGSWQARWQTLKYYGQRAATLTAGALLFILGRVGFGVNLNDFMCKS